MLRIIPYAALHFSAYESYRELLVKAAAAAAQKPLSEFVVPPYLDLIAGSAAGATAVLVRGFSAPALLHGNASCWHRVRDLFQAAVQDPGEVTVGAGRHAEISWY